MTGETMKTMKIAVPLVNLWKPFSCKPLLSLGRLSDDVSKRRKTTECELVAFLGSGFYQIYDQNVSVAVKKTQQNKCGDLKVQSRLRKKT